MKGDDTDAAAVGTRTVTRPVEVEEEAAETRTSVVEGEPWGGR